MNRKLPVPVCETYYFEYFEKVFYHNGKINSRWYARYLDKSDICDNHKYKVIEKWKTAILKDEYKDYQISIPKTYKYEVVIEEL